MKLCPQCDTGYPDDQSTCPTHGAPLSEIRELRPGMVVRKSYRVVRKLGQGGFGTVYLADHLFMEEQRALKFLSADVSSDPGLAARFQREVRMLRQIRHKNVVDCGDMEPAEDNSLFFSMEFVDGPDLWDFMQRQPKPFDVELALAITRGVAEGLGAAHALGMVHRDVKPENILLANTAGKWTPKIADFGIVATKESSAVQTKTGASLLTTPYAAPEQWRGTPGKDLDGRTDLYALGCVLFEMLTGKTVFEAENYEGWARQHLNTPPRPVSTLRPDLKHWKGLDALVIQLLAKEPERRPANVVEVIKRIDAIRYLPPVEKKPNRLLIDFSVRRTQGIAVACLVVIAGTFAAAGYFAGKPGKASPDDIFQAAQARASQKQYAEAAVLFGKACNLSNRYACNELGLLYHHKLVGGNDITMAKNLFYRSCQLGLPVGCANLGALFDPTEADNFETNLLLASSLYKRACADGDDLGCTRLAQWERRTSSAFINTDVLPYARVGCASGGTVACQIVNANGYLPSSKSPRRLGLTP